MSRKLGARTITASKYIGRLPVEGGQKLARVFSEDDADRIIVDMRGLSPSVLVSAFFRSFYSTLMKENPKAIFYLDRTEWKVDHEFQQENIDRWTQEMRHKIVEAAHTQDIERFLELAFPSDWAGIAARILETGATFAKGMCKWAPRWSQIPQTERYGQDGIEHAFKSVIFRVHDCLHQLWGLPHPIDFTEDEFYYYKRTQMCGEVAVLTLTEFFYVNWLADEYPEHEEFLRSRNALPLLDGPLAGKSISQIAMRLDDLLHKKRRPKWVRDNPHAIAFVEDYVPMLEKDREQINNNWLAMRQADWLPHNAPKASFGRDLDGLEVTIWMIEDFFHLFSTDPTVDRALMEFNRERRSHIVLPKGWDS